MRCIFEVAYLSAILASTDGCRRPRLARTDGSGNVGWRGSTRKNLCHKHALEK